MQAVILLVGVLMLLLALLIGGFHKVSFISPANAPLFESLSQEAQGKLCKKFCVVPLLCGIVLVAFYFVASMLELPRNAYLLPLLILLLLTMFDFIRVSKIITQLRNHSFPDSLD